MEKTIKELEKQLAALEKSEEKLGKLIDNPLERTVLETKQEVNNFVNYPIYQLQGIGRRFMITLRH